MGGSIVLFHVFYIKVRPNGQWFHGSSFVTVVGKDLKISPKLIIEEIEKQVQEKCAHDCSVIIGNIVNVENVFTRKRMFWDGFLFGIFWFFIVVIILGKMG